MIGSRKKAIFQSHVCEIEDKKTAYNEGCLYKQTFSKYLSIFKVNFLQFMQNNNI